MSTPEATRKACDALYRAMGELDTFEDRPDLASPTTRGAFEDCYEMLAELAVAKGLIKLPIRTQRSESPTNEDRSTEGDEGSDEVGSGFRSLSQLPDLKVMNSRRLARRETSR
jgi:hypothetical protein